MNRKVNSHVRIDRCAENLARSVEGARTGKRVAMLEFEFALAQPQNGIGPFRIEGRLGEGS